MEKTFLKFDKKGNIRPYPYRKATEDMTERELLEENVFSLRNTEKNLNDTLKVHKSILLWIQVFGFSFIASIIASIALFLFS